MKANRNILTRFTYLYPKNNLTIMKEDDETNKPNGLERFRKQKVERKINYLTKLDKDIIK